MTHFYTSSLDVLENAEFRELASPWPGFSVRAQNTEAGEMSLIIMPTQVPLVRPGVSFVKIGVKYPILVPHEDQPGKYRDVRESGISSDRPDATWWVSRHTEDPFHVLIAWNGRDVLNLPGASEFLVALAKS